MTMFLQGSAGRFCGIFSDVVRIRLLSTFLCVGLLTACVDLNTAAPTAILPSAPTVTPTVLWFPPTRTPTAFPPPTPTSETLPTPSSLIFREDFSQPEAWTTVASPSARAVLEDHRLILFVDGRRLYLMTLRADPVLTDFYLQVTARLNLCHQRDAYGVLFRAAGRGDYYRYILNCQGQARLERARGGQIAPLTEWQESGDAPRGAPGEVSLGIWAVGAEMYLFLNGRFQFALHDTLFRAGQIGLFALSGEETPLAVVFSDLVVYDASSVTPPASISLPP